MGLLDSKSWNCSFEVTRTDMSKYSTLCVDRIYMHVLLCRNSNGTFLARLHGVAIQKNMTEILSAMTTLSLIYI
jgi:hypothetical protein